VADRPRAAVLALILLAAAALPAGAVEVQLRFSGGLGTVRPADLNTMLDAWRTWRKLETARTAGWSVTGEKIGRVETAFDFRAELVVALSSRFGIGLGSGYLYAETTEMGNFIQVLRKDGEHIFGRPGKVVGMPVILSGFVFQPLGKGWQLFARAGGGPVWARYTDREAHRLVDEDKYTYSSAIVATGRGTLLEGGLGLSFRPTPALGFLIEAVGRKGSVDKLEGETKDGDRGSIYALEEYLKAYNFWQAKILAGAVEFSGANYRAVRRTRVEFDGLTVRLGLIIRF